LIIADPVGLVGGFPFGHHMQPVLGQLIRGEVTLLIGGAGQYLLRRLPSGVAALAELVEKCHRAGSLPGQVAASVKAYYTSRESGISAALLHAGFDGTRMSIMSEAFILGPDEGRRLDMGNFEALVLATAAQTSSEFTLLQVQGEPPDFQPPLHLHRDTAEAFYVLEGEYLMYVQDRQQLCPPGTFVYVPRDTPHTFKVVSAIPGKKLVLFSPAAMLAYFEELAAAEAAGNATPEVLNAIGARNNVEMLGPVPDTYLR